MRRANSVTDEELRNFCEWFAQRFKTKDVRRSWFETSFEGHFHLPVRDLKDILRRMERLSLVSVKREHVQLLKV